MKRRTLFGIYGKILTYTLMILFVVIAIAASFFSNQITAVLDKLAIYLTKPTTRCILVI
jgi:hypothetical protein